MFTQIAQQLSQLNQRSPDYAARFVELLLAAAVECGASDVHLHPQQNQLEVRWRIDGVLQPLGTFARGAGADVVTRLKVLAELLTYRCDVPQEGRLRCGPQRVEIQHVEMRLSTFPTLHGERAVIRLFATASEYQLPEQLGLAEDALHSLRAAIAETSGAIVIAGPAGSGKTTTAYACLRAIVHSGATLKSVVTLEDPIEGAIPGVSQSQVQPQVGFTLATGLRSLLRQDPEVILVGEMRDPETVEGVFQASLTGHLVLSTFHAGSAAEAISRMLEMGMEPYLLRSGLQMVMCQRLLRRLCSCKQQAASDDQLLGLPVAREATFVPGACDVCLQTGYRGRLLLTEILSRTSGTLTPDLLDRVDAAAIEAAALKAGLNSLLRRASQAVAAGQTSPQEVRRVLGFQQKAL